MEKENKKCTTHCNWPSCTYSDCMEKHPEEWAKDGPHKIIQEALQEANINDHDNFDLI